MKHIIVIIVSMLFSCSAFAQSRWAQVAGAINHGFMGSTHEFIHVYYYSKQNTIETRRVLLFASDIISSKRSDHKYGDYHSPIIWVYGDATKVRLDSGVLYTYGGNGYSVKNIKLCNKKEPTNELEQRFTYKYLDSGIWYYFNAGLDLSLPSEKKSFKEKFKELLFK